MQVLIRLILLLYLIVCICLLLFNVFYIAGLAWGKRRRQKQIRRWAGELEAQMQNLAACAPVTARHRRLLETRLVKTGNLIAFSLALEPVCSGEQGQRYLAAVAESFRHLAHGYARKSSMERAFFADVLSRYGPGLQGEKDRIAPILLQFLPDSSIYCRENVLQALYALGSADGVMGAFHWMHQHQMFHPVRLLSDGLAGFTGDRLALAVRLWDAGRDWGASYQVAVIQMAAQFTSAFQAPLARLLQTGGASRETAFAALRYFQKYPYPPLRAYLYQLVLEDSELAIAAVTALQGYPGEDTKAVLLKGLRSRNFYVRRNAAAALAGMGVSPDAAGRIADRYAKQMLQYALQLKQAKGGMGFE